MSTTNDRAPVVDIEITGEAIQALAGVLTRYGNRGWTETEASHVLGLLVDNGWAMTPLGLDVRDRIIDRLAPDSDGWTWFPVLPGDFDTNADDAPCWVRFDDSGRRRPEVASEPMAPDEVAYFEARRANDG